MSDLSRKILAVTLFAVCLALPVAAQTPAPADPAQDATTLSFFRRVEISGFVDGYYQYNFNTPITRRDGPERLFDVRHDSFSLNLAEFAVEKKPTSDSRAGFRLDLDFGPTADLVKATEPGTVPTFRNIGQAYVSYLAPVGKGWQIDFGEFVTPTGNEVIKTRNNWNYSRSILFTLAIPFYHMGVRSTYSFNDKISGALYVVNGWNDIVDNNTKKTVAGQVAVKPFKSLTLTETYVGGAEQVDTAAWRNLSDTVATYTVTPKLSVAGNYDYGQDKQSDATVKWQGVAGYARFQPNSWFSISPRGEYYNDRDGFTSGQAQKIKEFTITGEAKSKDGFVMRLEYRHDWSDIPFFLKDNRFIDHQNTFTIGVIYSLSTKGI
jgi:putative OmpL-like beta-barrel porin-2